ncbi:hypothetical protein J5X98_02320 [Leptothermofonsia sichuanensis E412]|uniref:hypothetical protein n=1 Tax=Leptothermofonsia sichuanensis TaxID=2917832 RepID=UPI001CA6CBEB|nr:hypothetical protein [Leptothermofonsia sichuanensis]QZZ21341.1 hypothetical protein J5X98_02320 [Leptothermofonsia sichuanensis E412]
MVIGDAIGNLEARIPGVLLIPVKLTESSSQAPGIRQLLPILLVAGSQLSPIYAGFSLCRSGSSVNPPSPNWKSIFQSLGVFPVRNFLKF